ncbi:MAG: hypothetical protein HeimC2_33020 [Candidatus Heimdallarchaeota archaeon LC_2]|nr:MAG: hypothetical protein HeimC2_33020 [Candidatus Heimdallarchaeota archaeon LC_2]
MTNKIKEYLNALTDGIDLAINNIIDIDRMQEELINGQNLLVKALEDPLSSIEDINELVEVLNKRSAILEENLIKFEK